MKLAAHLAVLLFGVATAAAAENQEKTEEPRMRILALFSTTKNELGLDHRLGRQVLKLASQKVAQFHPELGQGKLEVVVQSDELECSPSNELPNRVVERYYSQDLQEECARESLGSGANCSEHDIDTKQLDRFFESSVARKKRWTNSTDSIGVGGHIDAILGPSCHYLVDVIARMAAYWRLPIYSVASISAQFASKDVYPTLTRLSPSIDQLSLFIVRTMQKFNWSHLAILADSSQIENTLMLENLERTIMRQSHLHPIKKKLIPVDSRSIRPVPANSTDTSTKCSPEARDTLMEARRVARAVLLLVDGALTVRQLLLCGHELGFRAQGFTFMALDLGLKSADYGQQQQQQQEKSTRSTAAAKGQQNGFDWYQADDEENNALAKQMFESLMVFSVELPLGEEYNLFVEQTLDLANQAYPQVRFERSAVNALAVALHDSLLLAVEAHLKHRPQSSRATRRVSYANKSSIDDADWRELSAAVPLLWAENTATVPRRSGGLISTSLHINANGDQELDYVLSDLEPELGVMRPVASFSKESRQLELLPDTYVHWPRRMNTLTRELVQDSDQVPPDEPECGFDDQAEHCVDRQNLYAALTILASLVALLGLASAFSLYKYRSIKYQMQLDDYWWKINWEDLQFVRMTESLASNAQGIARALKSGASVVSAGSDGAASYVSVMKPRAGGHALKLQTTPAPTTTNKQQVVGDSESTVSKATRRQRRQAVPLIVTSPGGAAADQAAPSEVHEDARSAMTKTSGSLLAAGSVLIRSEYSSVVRASNLALYKDELVIVKQLNAEQIEVSRELLVELKSIRELVNDNLARFVGLCLDSQRLAIVYEFCSRGSLQDLILNKDVAIDPTLKYSIIGDIVNGLSFIHTTLLDYHGRLKSTNLVLDGRFTVKITDFGLQNLYSQLELVQNQAQDEEEEEDDDDEEDNEEDEANQRRQHDAISLSVSQSAYNMESVSMIGARRTRAGPSSHAGGSRPGYSRMRLRNRGAARFFWTAPEHLREKNTHFAGSKKGDIYSLSIILLELMTRREPYHYGTNAQPHWPNINRDRRLFMQQQQQQQQHQQSGSGSGSDHQQSAGSRLLSSVSRRTRTSQNRGRGRDQLGSEVSASVVGNRRPSAVAAGRLRHPKRNSVMPAPVEVDAISVISGSAMSHVSSATRDQPASIENERRQSTVRMSASGPAIDDEDALNREEEEDAVRELSAPNNQLKAASGAAKRLDAEEILDQLRMGVQPEPVRPYIPNYVAHSLSPKLIELVRACWQETSQARPPLAQIRTQLRKISRGLASRNYLDNLLDRLQNYAADLERIVDSKSADIMGEKLRTEELLYQLVPKFVAERLKRSEPIVPQVFDGVTIFFSDIVGFEKYASVMSPTELVDLLNGVYSSFDSIISSFDVTKIETIIDQFLVAAGISFQRQEQQQTTVAAIEEPSKEETPSAESKRQKRSRIKKIGLLGSLGKSSHASQDQPDAGQAGEAAAPEKQPQPNDSIHYRRSSAEQIGRMALCIRDLVKSSHFRQNLSQSQTTQSPLGSNFNIRIGIHSGKVCAGIVGVKRPKFCLIGDTVNVASRMHTNSKANRIQISDDTRQLLEQVPGFSIEPRGKIEIKGKGQMETFWLESSY